MITKIFRRKSGKGGEIQAPMSNTAEHHVDARHQPSLFPIGEKGEIMSKRNLFTGTVEELSPLEMVEMAMRRAEYLIGEVFRPHSTQSFAHTSRFVVSVQKEDSKEQTGRIEPAGLPGSSMVFLGDQEIPDREPRKCLEARVRNDLVATSGSLLILATWKLLKVVLQDDRTEEVRLWKPFDRKAALHERNMRETCQRKIREIDSMESFIRKDRGWQYGDSYTITLKTFATVKALGSMKPLQIGSLIRRGQLLAENQDGYTGNGVSDALLACRYLNLTFDDIHKVFEKEPELLALLGWHRVSVSDED